MGTNSDMILQNKQMFHNVPIKGKSYWEKSLLGEIKICYCSIAVLHPSYSSLSAPSSSSSPPFWSSGLYPPYPVYWSTSSSLTIGTPSSPKSWSAPSSRLLSRSRLRSRLLLLLVLFLSRDRLLFLSLDRLLLVLLRSFSSPVTISVISCLYIHAFSYITARRIILPLHSYLQFNIPFSFW